jgi:acyl-CoA synthetase (AMP-forming)/AMP-acid ligase II
VNFVGLLQHRSSTAALAFITPEGALEPRTHLETLRNVQMVASLLRARDVRERNRVLVPAATRPQTAEAIMGVMAVGATALPVNPLMGTNGLTAILEQHRPDYALVGNGLGVADIALLQRFCGELLSIDAEGANVEPSVTRLTEPPDDLPALVMHTSGSDGRPKAIRFTHRALRTFMQHHEFLHEQFDEEGATEESQTPIVSVLPLSHFGGLALCMHGLMTRRPIYLMEHFLPGAYLRVIARARCRTIMLVPSMYRSLMRDPSFPHTDLSTLQFCISMGEPCTAELARRIEEAFGAKVASTYGLTECLTGIGHLRHDLLSGNTKAGSCGRLCFGDVKLTDENGRLQHESGELWVRNPTVRNCYLDEELNKSSLHDGWFRTRDLFHRDADGFFFHYGRSDDMFVYNGKNVYPVELESVLASHPSIELACAAPVVSRQSQRVVPSVLVQARHPISETEILDFAARHGAGHIIPHFVLLADSVPHVGPGKVDRKAIGRLLQSGYDQQFGAQNPLDTSQASSV